MSSALKVIILFHLWFNLSISGKSFSESLTPKYQCKTQLKEQIVLFCKNRLSCTTAPIFKNICIFHNISLDDVQVGFEATSDIPVGKVTEIDLGGWYHNSRIQVMTSDVCEVFINVKIIQARHLGVKLLQHGAFSECIELEVISLAFNQIQNVSMNQFETNTKLKKLDLSWNRLTILNPNIFTNLVTLKSFDISGNLLAEFPIHRIRQLNSLSVLKLQHNNLLKLNEKKLIEKFPNLKHLFLCPNPKLVTFDLENIMEYLENKNVEVTIKECQTPIVEQQLN